jgi:hypothetical protein
MIYDPFLIIFPRKVVSLEFLESGQCSIFSRSVGGKKRSELLGHHDGDVIQPIDVEGDRASVFRVFVSACIFLGGLYILVVLYMYMYM